MASVKLEAIKKTDYILCTYTKDQSKQTFVFDLKTANALYSALKNNEHLLSSGNATVNFISSVESPEYLCVSVYIPVGDTFGYRFTMSDIPKKQFFEELKKVLADLLKSSLQTPFLRDLIVSGELAEMIGLSDIAGKIF